MTALLSLARAFQVEVSRCVGFKFGGKGGGSSKQKTTGEELCQSPWGITTHNMAPAHGAISAAKLWTDLGQEGHLAFEKTGKRPSCVSPY